MFVKEMSVLWLSMRSLRCRFKYASRRERERIYWQFARFFFLKFDGGPNWWPLALLKIPSCPLSVFRPTIIHFNLSPTRTAFYRPKSPKGSSVIEACKEKDRKKA